MSSKTSPKMKFNGLSPHPQDLLRDRKPRLNLRPGATAGGQADPGPDFSQDVMIGSRTMTGRRMKEVSGLYNAYFNFSQSPFENNLDQRFTFLSEGHQEAMAALLYFIETQKGLAFVCGDVGTGKTMLINAFLDRLPETVKPIIIPNPYVSSLELLSYLAKNLETKGTDGKNVLELTDQIKNALLEAKSHDKQLVLIIDEAHLLSDQVLEEIRLLLNIETPDQKLLHILLVGQYGLSRKLDRPEMWHLRQRISINRFLSHLNFSETIRYIDHRLHQVGSSFALVFQDNCKAPIYKMTNGIPRLINLLCEHALLISVTEGRPQVNRRILTRAMESLETDRIFTPPTLAGGEASRFWKNFKILAPVGVGVALGLIGIIAATMPGKFSPISQVIRSITQAAPEVKAPPQPAKIKEPQAPGLKKAPPPREATAPARTTPPPRPQPALKKGRPVTTSPSPAQGAPAVKQGAAPAPDVTEGFKPEKKPEEIAPPATTPENLEKVEAKAPETPAVQVKPEANLPAPEPAPAAPAFEKIVTRGGETLTRIATKHYPQDPKFGIVAIILQNPSISNEDSIKAGEVLQLPKIDFKNRTIQLDDNLWYALYDYYTSAESAKKIALWLTGNRIKFVLRDIKKGGGSTIKWIFIGGYATENELAQALDSLTTEKQ
jgi:general secretion pathway protein A